MANYTIELFTLINDPSFELFDFDYKFYINDAARKKEFEKKFIDTYAFHEIGDETVARFKFKLRAELNLRADYYNQLYKTQLAAEGIEFLLNKDYTETFTKQQEIDRSANSLTDSVGTNNNSMNSNATSKSTSNDSSNSKESALDNGVASVGLVDSKLTAISASESSGATNNSDESRTTSDSTSNNNIEMNTHGKDVSDESYTLTGKGNIGTTSSAELLEKWRQTLISVDELLIKDMRKLFLLIY